MPKFKVIFEREVVELDQYIEEIEADDLIDANNKALMIAHEMDQDCPDDVTTLSSECRSWHAQEVLESV